MKKAAHFFSFVFSPLLVSTYGTALALWFSRLCYLPLSAKWTLLAVVFALTAAMPAIFIFALNKLGLVSDVGLNKRNERPLPYCITCVFYLATAYYFFACHLPSWMVLFMAGGAVAVVVSLVVNIWWKISAHLAGMGGMIGLMLRMFANGNVVDGAFPALIIVILLTGIVASSRVYLERHTFGQVVAGAINGAVCVYILSGL